MINAMEGVPLIDKPPLATSDKLGYSLGHVQNDLFASMWFSYALIFFQIVTYPDTLISGVFILMGQLVDAFATPVAGYFIDYMQKKQKWHIFGSIVTSISFPVIFSVCYICSNQLLWMIIYYSIGIIVFQLGWAFVQISHLSILPGISSNNRERAELTSYRHCASMMANILLYTITWGFFANTRSTGSTLLSTEDYSRFLNIALTSCFIGIAFTVAFHALMRNKTVKHQLLTNEKVAWGSSQVVKSICQSKDLYMITAVYTSSRLFLNLTMGYMQLYMNEIIISYKEAVAIIPLTMFLSSAVTSFLYKRCFSNFEGNKFIFVLGWFFIIMGCALVYLKQESSDNISDVMFSAFLFGIGSALTIVVSLTLAANLAKCKGSEAFVYSSVTFTDKAVNGLLVMLIEYMKCEDDQCTHYYKYIIVFVNGSIISIGLLFVLCLPKDITSFVK